ncbi:MAG TPA: ATP-dependent metallopeptidase FtsH/Yme1/Tma family protein [Candidatus Saccharimonadales bacterium]|nr:ATP-dependent metallopeptidase FtsH/Yme1/Tma family protein [Candidatus Saccharimonadales bacterium]
MNVLQFKRWWREKAKPVAVHLKPVWPVLALMVFFLMWPLLASPEKHKPDTKPISQFYADLKQQKVQELELQNDHNQMTVTLKDGEGYLVAYPTGYGPNLVEAAEKANPRVPLTVAGKGFAEKYQWFFGFLFLFLFLLLLIWLNRTTLRSMSIGNSLKSSGVVVAPAAIPNVRFKDVGGADEVIAEIAQSVDALKYPEKYKARGVKPLTGILLLGDPGTGKTLLARAIAGEAGVPFFSMKGSDFMGRWLNDGPRAVKEAFAQIRRHGRGILFIDEIDSIASKRSSNDDSGSKELNNTLNELLAQMDGFTEDTDATILVLGATNRPDDLDPGIMRPGRFTRHASMPAPDPKARELILRLHAAKLAQVDDDVSYAELARLTSGMTGAKLAALCNQAGLLAIKRDAPSVTMKDFRDALEIIEVGLARNREVAERDRNYTAYHESGHALVAMLLEHGDPPHRVTIVPRGGSGGHTRMDTGDWLYLTVKQLKARLAYYMGGRAAERVIFGDDFTTGPESDLEVATQLATYMVTKVGMGEKYTAQVPLGTSGHDPRLADVTAEIDKLVKEAEQTAITLLTGHREKLELLRTKLLEVESLDAEGLQALFAAPAAA